MSFDDAQKILEKLDKIERGLYGDPDNKQAGVLARVETLEELAEKLSNAKWYVLGAVGILTAFWGIIQAAIQFWGTFKGGG